MSFQKKNPQCSPDQPLQTHSENQGLEVAQESEVVEEACLFSHPPMPGNLKEALDAGIPSSSESPQSFCSTLVVTTVTSSSESSESSSSQKEESGTSVAVPDPMNVSTDALDENVASLVNFLLFKYQMKEPITKADILKIITKKYQDHFIEIFLRASICMEIIFGFDVKEVDPTNHCYAVFIKLGLTYDGMLHGEFGVPKTGILILILGVIFMKGNRATEEEIWEVLSAMSLYPGKKHYIFGEPRKLITKYFVKEEYLMYQQVANSDPAKFEFLWGPKAHAETTKMQVLEFMAKVHGTDPSCFPSQYEDALQD
uniref:MAGE family member B16 n=2 Tax=Molossus molossus TaxID=27622 RepID=A0A7J8J6Q1_MOLMO|nr:MAGE family member B16 [Molossus molossus]